MKTISIVETALFALAIAACSDEQEKPTCSALRNITITARDFEPDASTRTDFKITDKGAEFAWAANDTVGIFPETGGQVYFPMTSGAGTKTASFSGGGWALKDAARYAAYYPFVGSFYLNREAIPVNYTGQTQVGDASTAHLGAYDYMAAAPATPQGGNANFAFNHLGCLVQLKLKLSEPASVSSVTLQPSDGTFTAEGTVNLLDDHPTIRPVKSTGSLTLQVRDVQTSEAGQTVTLYLMMPPIDLTGKKLTASVKTSNGGSYSLEFAGKNYQAGKAYALSGETPAGDAYVEVTLKKGGFLKVILGDQIKLIPKLKCNGPLNGDDITCINEMCYRYNLTDLDISDALIVGNTVYFYPPDFRHGLGVEDNQISKGMFCAVKQIILPNYLNSISIGEDKIRSEMTSVYFSEYSMTSIGEDAFRGYTHLATLYFPKYSVTSIGNYAFYDCSSLTTLDFPESLTYIGKYAFRHCTGLTTLHLPKQSVQTIDRDAFYGCTSLTNFEFPESLTSIGGYAFYGCTSLTNLYFPKSLTSIGRAAFAYCLGLISVNFPESLTSIEDNVFRECTGLTILEFPGSLTNVEYEAFKGCTGLTTLNFPESLTGIGYDAFADCTNLTSVHFSGRSLTTIEYRAFSGCTHLTTITFPKSLKSIGRGAFEGCTGLTTVYCHATTPPEIYSGVFEVTTSKLYVPKGCVAAYEASEWGKCFYEILEIE